MGRLRVEFGKEIYFERHPGGRTVVLSHGGTAEDVAATVSALLQFLGRLPA